MKQVHNNDINQLYFENVTDFENYLNKNSDKPDVKSKIRLQKNNKSFYGTNSWDEFIDILKNGDSEITNKAKTLTRFYLDNFEDKFTFKTSFETGLTGQFFDIGAVMSGEPECWLNEITLKDDKFITLKIQGTYPWRVDKDVVIKNGSKLFAICSSLERQGYLTEIDFIYSLKACESRNPNKFTTIMIPLKKYDDILDYKKLGILLSPSFFRRGILRLLEIEYGTNVTEGYGKPVTEEGEISLSKINEINKLEKKLLNKEDWN